MREKSLGLRTFLFLEKDQNEANIDNSIKKIKIYEDGSFQRYDEKTFPPFDNHHSNF